MILTILKQSFNIQPINTNFSHCLIYSVRNWSQGTLYLATSLEVPDLPSMVSGELTAGCAICGTGTNNPKQGLRDREPKSELSRKLQDDWQACYGTVQILFQVFQERVVSAAIDTSIRSGHCQGDEPCLTEVWDVFSEQLGALRSSQIKVHRCWVCN